MRRATSLAVALFGLVFAHALDANAERVVLLEPQPSDAVLFDAFNRLAAELRIQRFDIESVAAPAGEAPAGVLSATAEKTGAVAAIALVRHGDDASVDVWLVDRLTGKTTLRTIVAERGADESSVLAIRAVDLLRASLQEFPAGERPPADVANVERRAATPVVAAFTARDEPRILLRADAVLFAQTQASIAVGPSLSAAYRVSRRFEIGVGGAGPLLGGRVERPEGGATLQQGMAWGEARFDAIRAAAFDAGVNGAVGAYFLGAEGQPRAPLEPRSGGLVAALGALGVHADVAIVPSLSVGITVRLVATLPRAGIAIGETSVPFGRPAVLSSAGIRVAL
jgi:hypothetical protein